MKPAPLKKKKSSSNPTPKKTKRPTLTNLIKLYWLHLTIITVIAGYGINRTLELRQYAQSCMTAAMVSADTRCLYIYQTHVYQKGTRSNPHKGNPCGTDVTSIIPSFHFMSAATYLDPNLVGTMCSSTPPTATPIPTTRPTNTPVPTTRPTSTPVATPRPTNTPIPTQPPTATPSVRPTTVPTTIPTQTPTPVEPTATPSLPPISQYPSWWTMIPLPLRNYLEILYYWVFYFRRPSENSQILEGVFPSPTP